ncbi:hypothetical protein GCM10009716_38680 [Streptomyces sodiiphilus]|uniref:Uncharacterized protein n=1 Tax=Streptomyces sodiiphilus TaxID=226217 RepID=A0ABN2PND2_9ACTN
MFRRDDAVPPVGEDIGGLYADYQWKRDRVREAADCDMVFVNLFAAPFGQPMKYPSTSRLSRAEADRDGLRNQLTEAQDDLIAARQALRTMMRDQNRSEH